MLIKQLATRQGSQPSGRQAGRQPEAGSKSGNQIQTKPETHTRTTAAPPQPVGPLASGNSAGANSGPIQLRPVAHFEIL